MSSVTLNEAYGNAPWVFWICGVCLAIFVPLSILTYRTKKKVSQSKEANTTETTLENAIQSIYTEFEVPANAKNVDILTFYYKTKKDKIVAKAKGMMPEYINYEMKAYVSEDTFIWLGLKRNTHLPSPRFAQSALSKRQSSSHIGTRNWFRRTKPTN